jgi:hypothetical protein
MMARQDGDQVRLHKRMLITFWVLLLPGFIINLVMGVLAMTYYKRDYEDGTYSDLSPYSPSYNEVIAILASHLISCIIGFTIDVVNIVKFARRSLTPRFFFIVSSVQAALWTIQYGLSVSSKMNLILYFAIMPVL